MDRRGKIYGFMSNRKTISLCPDELFVGFANDAFTTPVPHRLGCEYPLLPQGRSEKYSPAASTAPL